MLQEQYEYLYEVYKDLINEHLKKANSAIQAAPYVNIDFTHAPAEVCCVYNEFSFYPGPFFWRFYIRWELASFDMILGELVWDCKDLKMAISLAVAFAAGEPYFTPVAKGRRGISQ